MFAENRLAPCMGSTVCEEYAGVDGADAAATWVVLKACVAEWELRLRYGNIEFSRQRARKREEARGLCVCVCVLAIYLGSIGAVLL